MEIVFFRLQKCTLNTLEHQETEEVRMEVTNEIGCHQANSKKSAILSYKPPLSDHFYEDKTTQTDFSQFLESPQMLDSEENLLNFTGR